MKTILINIKTNKCTPKSVLRLKVDSVYMIFNIILSVVASYNQYFIIHMYLYMYIRPSSPYTAVEHVELFTPSNELQNFNCIGSMPLHLVKPSRLTKKYQVVLELS